MTPSLGGRSTGYPLKPSDRHWCEYVNGKCCMCGADDPWERHGGVAHRLRKAAELGQKGPSA